METPKASDVKKGISALWDTLQCPICLDLMTAPVSTNCDHQFCKFCIFKLLDSSKQNKAPCPVCKTKITKRSLQESPGFQKLVAGLQDMIQSYEHDTSTNFFTGSSHQTPNLNSPHTTATKKQHNYSPANTDGKELQNGDNLPESHSSTIAAQNGYAQLIGFDDVHLRTANEGLDSGLGDGPSASDWKTYNSAEIVQTQMSDIGKEPPSTLQNKDKFDESYCLLPNSEPTEPQILRKSLRKKKKPEDVLEKRKKKSLEKVTEWLMKVPTQGSPELEDMEKDAQDSDSCSSTSTIDIHQHNFEFNMRKEEKAKALEDQVFGAIYKRERRSNRASSPPLNSLVKPSSKTEAKSRVAKCHAKDHLILDEFEQKSEENFEEENGMEDLENSNIDFLKNAEREAVREENGSSSSIVGFDNLLIIEKSKCMPMVSFPLTDIEQQQHSAKPQRKTRNSIQQVDNDLKEQANQKSEGTEQNKNDRKKSTSRRLNRKKPEREAKPLVLVGVENGGSSPKKRGRPVEVQVLIESYPSSLDQEALPTGTRRSKRLQDFQVDPKKGVSKAPRKARDSKRERLDSTTLPENSSTMNDKARNGCIFEQDLGEIEYMETTEKLSCIRAEENVAEMINVEPVRLPCVSGVSIVPNSISPTQKSVLKPTVENKNPPGNVLNNTPSEASVCEAEGVDLEDEDNELDTEQLLKSFIATKRKSFHLHGPDSKNTRSCSDKVNVLGPALDVGSEQTPPKALTDSGKSHQSNLISPSASAALRRMRTCESPDQVVVNSSNHDRSLATNNPNYGNSLSSFLTPNQVSKLEVDSLHQHDHNSFGDSEIQEGELDCITVDDVQVKEGDNSSCCLVDREEDNPMAESYLTLDVLAASAVEKEPNSNPSGETSIHSSLKRNPRRKRSAQKLESSSSSDCSGSKDDLPSLAQIFGTTTAPAPTQDQEVSSEAKRCEVVEDALDPPSSPDCVGPSQASVDLFGTPEEAGDVPINTEVFTESSQFSSEVLVTQQKIEMQKELVRLEKLMALVSEVLQEKEESPSKDAPVEGNQKSKAAGSNSHRSNVCDQDAAQGSGCKDGTGAERDSNASASDGKGITEACATNSGGSKDVAAQPFSHSGLTFKAAAHSKVHNSTPAAKTEKNCSSPSDGQEDKENDTPPKDKSKSKMLLASSGLGPSQQIMVKKFAKRVGTRVVSQVTSDVTHIIMRTDEQLVCERTLKYFLGIAGRKWVVSFQWISECFEQKKLLDESPFEVRGDVVNGPNHQGPHRARTTEDSNLLMKGYKICFQGSFTDMSTVEMEWMVELCGAAVVRDPLHFDCQQKSNQLVIVQPRSKFSSSTSSNLSEHATVVNRGWLLDTVATYTLQNYHIYTT